MAGQSGWLARGLAACVLTLGLAAACGDSSDGESQGAAGSGGSSGSSGASGGAAGRPTGGAAGVSGTNAGNGGAGKSNGGAGSSNGGASGGASSAEGGAVGHGGEPGGAGSFGGSEEPPGGAGNGGDTGEGGAPSCTEPLAQPPAASCGVYGTVGAEQQIEQATEQLSLSAELRVGPLGPVRLDEVELHYYFSQEETSGFQAKVDSFVLQPGDVDLTSTSEITILPLVPHQSSTSGPGCQTHFVRIRNSSALPLAKADQNGKPFVELHFTLKPNNPAPPNQVHTNDHSYHAGLAAFVCGSLVSGCTPGDAGTCN